MSTENSQKQQRKTAVHLAQALAQWAISVNDWNPKDLLSDLNEMKTAYLCSDLANDKQDRQSVIFTHSLLERALKEIKHFPQEAFSNINNLKITHTCTTETP